MLAEIRERSQITIPAEIIKKIGAKIGDKFDVIVRDGGIFLCPVVVYPKDKMKKIAKLIKETEADMEAGNTKVYSDIDKMFSDMGVNLDEVQN
jgi:antitoxin MazE